MLALTAAILPVALCAQAPPTEWPPEEEWHPMSPGEARPDMLLVAIYGGECSLTAGEPFYFFYGWSFLPTNEAYDFKTGQPVIACANLQDRTDSANCRYTVTMQKDGGDALPLEPTSSLTAGCRWNRFWNSFLPRPPRYEGDYWAVAPRAVVHEYYIEFPGGLDRGDYLVRLHAEPSGGVPFDVYTAVHVTDP